MVIIKKLIFAPAFLLTFWGFCYQLIPYLQNPSLIISFASDSLSQLIILSLLLLSSGVFFVIFATLALDPKFILPVILLAAMAPLPLISFPLSFVLSAGFLLFLGVVYFLLERKLQTYLTFQANFLLIPSIKQLVTLTLLVASLAFYLASDSDISQNGFKIPDSIIDMSLKFAPSEADVIRQAGLDLNQTGGQESLLTPAQIELLKQNPEMLKQYGIDPKMLDTLTQTQAKTQTPAKIDTQALLKPMIQNQIQSLIKPYLKYLPFILTGLFFITLQSATSLLGIILPLAIWLIFDLLEKTGFTKFEVEMREVKKLMV